MYQRGLQRGFLQVRANRPVRVPHVRLARGWDQTRRGLRFSLKLCRVIQFSFLQFFEKSTKNDIYKYVSINYVFESLSLTF